MDSGGVTDVQYHENNDFQPPKWVKEGLPWPRPQRDTEVSTKAKKGKSPGIDRISNEMIIASYPIMKDVFHKLLNFIFSSRNAPEIWCKGVARGGVHDLRMDGGLPPGFQKGTLF